MYPVVFHAVPRAPAVAYTFGSAAVKVRRSSTAVYRVKMSKHASQQRNELSSPIPDKLYFRIGEVAKLCGVEAYVLRFWETEFPQLRPNKSGTGQRLYRRRDVELALRIKRLLYAEGYTIAGARQVFAAEVREPHKKSQPELPLRRGSEADRVDARLKKLRAEVRELLGILSAPPAVPAKREVAERVAAEEKLEPGRGLFDS